MDAELLHCGANKEGELGQWCGDSVSPHRTVVSLPRTVMSPHHCPSSPSLFAQQCSSYASMRAEGGA